MTEIAFHFNVADKLIYGCRLLRKAYLCGASVVVTASAETLTELDQMLWRFSAAEFVPHCRVPASQASLAATPVLLAESPTGCPHHRVLVNLGQAIPPEFERFERFIEVVALTGDDVVAGRSRWKHYAARGYALVKHDCAPHGVGA